MSEPARGGLPPKVYFRIGEVAELVGVEPHVLRYWEREFRSIRPTKSAKGQRVYSRRDVENLMRVRQLLYSEGFTIAGAKKKLQHGGLELPDASEPIAKEPGPEAEQTAWRASEDPSNARQRLLAIREDIEAFLAELGTSNAVAAPTRSGDEGGSGGGEGR